MTNPTQRIYASDALRAIMLLPGVVFHSGISYTVENQGRTSPLKDVDSTSCLMDYLIGYIHIFRMPIFCSKAFSFPTKAMKTQEEGGPPVLAVKQ